MLQFLSKRSKIRKFITGCRVFIKVMKLVFIHTLRWVKNSISLSSGNRNVWLRSLPGSECRRLWWICRRLRGSARNSWSPFWDLQNMFKNYFQVSLSLLHLRLINLTPKKKDLNRSSGKKWPYTPFGKCPFTHTFTFSEASLNNNMLELTSMSINPNFYSVPLLAAVLDITH